MGRSWVRAVSLGLVLSVSPITAIARTSPIVLSPSPLQDRIRQLRFIGSELRNSPNPIDGAIGVLDVADGVWHLSQWAQCLGEACNPAGSVGAFLLEKLVREVGLRMNQKHFAKPGTPILPTQVEYASFVGFLAQADLHQKISPELRSIQNETFLFEFRNLSRQLQGVGLVPGGIVLRDRLINELVMTLSQFTKVKETLGDLRQELEITSLSKPERWELLSTLSLLERGLENGVGTPGHASDLVLYGVSVGQYYLFLPLVISQSIRARMSYLKEDGRTSCFGDFCTEAANRPLTILLGFARGADKLAQEVHQTYLEDLERRFPSETSASFWSQFTTRFQKDFARRFPCAQLVPQN